ncbi:MAG: hypothetical protein OXH00_07775 [Candidatus Poribacteria bacterium]|nr:hypothetical protein [Candidatus Poribacteria bacterium]
MANYQKNIQSQANPTNWAASATLERFTYKAETNRPWKPEKILELLEQAHQAFERLMGPGLGIVIEVEDRICEPNNLGARAEINKQIHSAQDYTIEVKFICEFPQNYGNTEQERDLAYHFFAHELFHCWVGGEVSTDGGLIVEAITQYMTDWTLVHLGWCSEDLRIRGRIKSQQIIDNAIPPHTTIARYKLFFDQMHIDAPKKFFDFCKDLAACFRQQRSREETDISPVLQRYLGTALEED